LFFHPNHFSIRENYRREEKKITIDYRASSSPKRGVVGVVEPLRGEGRMSFAPSEFELVDVASRCSVRRLGSLSERDEVFDDVDDACELSVVDDVDLSSIDPFLDGTDAVDGTRPRRLKR
jgi:hypothetical protein